MHSLSAWAHALTRTHTYPLTPLRVRGSAQPISSKRGAGSPLSLPQERCAWTPASRTPSGLDTRSSSLVLCAEGWLCLSRAPGITQACHPGVREQDSTCPSSGGTPPGSEAAASRTHPCARPRYLGVLHTVTKQAAAWFPAHPSCRPVAGHTGLARPLSSLGDRIAHPPPCSAAVLVPALRSATTWLCPARLKTP